MDSIKGISFQVWLIAVLAVTLSQTAYASSVRPATPEEIGSMSPERAPTISTISNGPGLAPNDYQQSPDAPMSNYDDRSSPIQDDSQSSLAGNDPYSPPGISPDYDQNYPPPDDLGRDAVIPAEASVDPAGNVVAVAPMAGGPTSPDNNEDNVRRDKSKKVPYNPVDKVPDDLPPPDFLQNDDVSILPAEAAIDQGGKMVAVSPAGEDPIQDLNDLPPDTPNKPNTANLDVVDTKVALDQEGDVVGVAGPSPQRKNSPAGGRKDSKAGARRRNKDKKQRRKQKKARGREMDNALDARVRALDDKLMFLQDDLFYLKSQFLNSAAYENARSIQQIKLSLLDKLLDDEDGLDNDDVDEPN